MIIIMLSDTGAGWTHVTVKVDGEECTRAAIDGEPKESIQSRIVAAIDEAVLQVSDV